MNVKIRRLPMLKARRGDAGLLTYISSYQRKPVTKEFEQCIPVCYDAIYVIIGSLAPLKAVPMLRFAGFQSRTQP